MTTRRTSDRNTPWGAEGTTHSGRATTTAAIPVGTYFYGKIMSKNRPAADGAYIAGVFYKAHGRYRLGRLTAWTVASNIVLLKGQLPPKVANHFGSVNTIVRDYRVMDKCEVF